MKSNEFKSKIKIEQHSLWEFLKDVQEAIQKGYVLDLETNEHFPQSYGSYYSATVVQAEPKTVEVKIVVDATEAISEVEKAIASIPVEPTEPVVKRTRKPKAEVVDAPAPE